MPRTDSFSHVNAEVNSANKLRFIRVVTRSKRIYSILKVAMAMRCGKRESWIRRRVETSTSITSLENEALGGMSIFSRCFRISEMASFTEKIF